MNRDNRVLVDGIKVLIIANVWWELFIRIEYIYLSGDFPREIERVLYYNYT